MERDTSSRQQSSPTSTIWASFIFPRTLPKKGQQCSTSVMFKLYWIQSITRQRQYSPFLTAINSHRQVLKDFVYGKNILCFCAHNSHEECQQGSICVPRGVYTSPDNNNHGVASSIEFNNKENLLLPPFQNNPRTNLSTVISFSINNGSDVQITDESSPIRITFGQVQKLILIINYMVSPSAFGTAKC